MGQNLSAEQLRRDWNRCHSAFYHLTEDALLWNLERQDWLRYSLIDAAGVLVLVAEAAPAGAAAGLSSKTLWVSLFGAVPVGGEYAFVTALLAEQKARGKTRLAFGGEEFHFVSGLAHAEEAERRMLPVLERMGFQGAEAVDYAGSLATAELRHYVSDACRVAEGDGWKLSVAASPEARAELGAFLRANFAGRWEREFRFWAAREDTGVAFWNLLRDREGQLLGFSRLGLRGSESGAWLPGALRLPLAENAAKSTDACLGPIGLAPAARGRGAGKVLLGLSLQLLLDRNAERVCIDWTNAYNYYKPLGLPVVRNFRSVWHDD